MEAFWGALSAGNVSAIKQMISEGAVDLDDVLNAENAQHHASLEVASRIGHIGLAPLLIDQGAEMNDALHYACANDNLEMVQLLVQHGRADVEVGARTPSYRAWIRTMMGWGR